MNKIGGDIFVANANQSRCWFKCSKTKVCKYTQEWRLQFEDATHKEAKYIFIKSLHNHTCFQEGNEKGNQYSDDFSFIDEKVKIQIGKRTLDDFNNISNSENSTAGEKKIKKKSLPRSFICDNYSCRYDNFLTFYYFAIFKANDSVTFNNNKASPEYSKLQTLCQKLGLACQNNGITKSTFLYYWGHLGNSFWKQLYEIGIDTHRKM